MDTWPQRMHIARVCALDAEQTKKFMECTSDNSDAFLVTRDPKINWALDCYTMGWEPYDEKLQEFYEKEVKTLNEQYPPGNLLSDKESL